MGRRELVYRTKDQKSRKNKINRKLLWRKRTPGKSEWNKTQETNSSAERETHTEEAKEKGKEVQERTLRECQRLCS